MSSHCLNCGERVYRGMCTNCHEENYIERQYEDLNMPVPEAIYEKSRKNEQEVYLNPVDDLKNRRGEG